jgi:hypothetical protein
VCVCVLCVCVCRSTDANKRASAHETNCPELLAWAKSKRCKHTVWREAALPSPGSETSKASTDSLSDCSEASNESEALSAGTRPPPPDSNASEAGTFSPRPLRVLVHPEPELLPDSPIGEEVVGGVVVIQYKRVRVSYGGGGEEDALRSWVREVGESEFSSSEQEEGQEDGEGCNLSREEHKEEAVKAGAWSSQLEGSKASNEARTEGSNRHAADMQRTGSKTSSKTSIETSSQGERGKEKGGEGSGVAGPGRNLSEARRDAAGSCNNAKRGGGAGTEGGRGGRSVSEAPRVVGDSGRKQKEACDSASLRPVPQPDSDSSDEDLPLAHKLLKQPEARVAASLRAGATAPSEAARREIQTVPHKTPKHSAQDRKQDKSVKTGINSDVFARQHIATCRWTSTVELTFRA